MLQKYDMVKQMNVQNIDPILNQVVGYNFHNHSPYTFDKLVADSDHLAENMRSYINGFSENARDILEHFQFETQITKLEDADLLIRW